MKYFLLAYFLIISLVAQSQCAGTQTFTLTPLPVNGTYNPGQIVTLCYTMTGYTQSGTNWFEGFDLNLGPGWASVAPQTAPANCGGNNTGGQWIWMNTVTATTPPGLTVGPGYFFDLDNDNNAGDDFGDSGSCTWTFCVTLTVSSSCTPLSLFLQVTAGPDGLWGSYTNNACDNVSPVTVFNGTINANPPVISPISHN